MRRLLFWLSKIKIRNFLGLSLVVAILSTLIDYIGTGWGGKPLPDLNGAPRSSLILIGCTTLVLVALLLSRLLYYRFTRSFVEVDVECKSTFCPISKGIFGALPEPCTFYVYPQTPNDTNKYHFVNNNSLAMESAVINSKIFSSSLWSESIHTKRKRNLAHSRKNSKVIMLVEENTSAAHENGGLVVRGFTHVIPVTKATWDLYLGGKISDNKFHESMVCKSGSRASSNGGAEEPHGLICFSMGAYKRTEFIKEYGIEPEKVTDSFLTEMTKAFAYHLNTLLREHFIDTPKVPILIQTERLLFTRIFNKYNLGCGKDSADGCPIFIGYLRHDMHRRNH